MPEPVKPLSAPPVTVTCVAVKELAGSLRVKVMFVDSPAFKATFDAAMTTVGAVVSMAMSLLAPIEPAAPGVGRVRYVFVPSLFLMVPPLRAIAAAET